MNGYVEITKHYEARRDEGKEIYLCYEKQKKEMIERLGNNHLIFMGGGGGQEDLSEPENFFFAYFWSRRIF